MKKKKKIHSQLQKETHKSGSGISSNSFSAPQNNRLDKSITKRVAYPTRPVALATGQKPCPITKTNRFQFKLY